VSSNYIQETASLDTALAAQGGEISKSLRVSLPAVVSSFDEARQAVTLTITIDGVAEDGSQLPIPPLVDVPVSFPRGGGFAFTFPLATGDAGIVVFSDRALDTWLTSGKQAIPSELRFHDLSDAQFIPGITPFTQAIPGFRTDAIVMRQLTGSGYVSIDSGGNVDVDGTQLTVHCPATFMKPVMMQDTLTVAGLFTYQGGMTGSGGEGSVASITGAVNVTGDVVINGVKLGAHIHPGDSGGQTGPAENG
jgi:phage baseplate assembly protein gpV